MPLPNSGFTSPPQPLRGLRIGPPVPVPRLPLWESHSPLAPYFASGLTEPMVPPPPPNVSPPHLPPQIPEMPVHAPLSISIPLPPHTIRAM